MASSSTQRESIRQAQKVFGGILLGLVLLVTSPFTLGPVLVQVGTAYQELNLFLASYLQPLPSWGIVAGLSVLVCYLVTLTGILIQETEGESSARKAWIVGVIAVISIVGWLIAWLALPPSATLVPALLALGGVPSFLVQFATFILMVTATFPLIAVIVTVFIGLIALTD